MRKLAFCKKNPIDIYVNGVSLRTISSLAGFMNGYVGTCTSSVIYEMNLNMQTCIVCDMFQQLYMLVNIGEF